MSEPASRATKDPAEHIQHLIEELEATAGPGTWDRIEALVHALTELYGTGLRTLIDRAALTRPQLVAASEDATLSGLLLLHGVHPLSIEERILEALTQVRPYLGSHAGDVELLSVDLEGRARLRLLGTCRNCPSSRETVEGMLRRAVEDAAPELIAVDVEGVSDASPKPQSSARWTRLDGIAALADGERCAIEVDGVPVLLLGSSASVLAYRNACPGCGARLDGAAVAGPELACSGCGSRFDVAHAGRAVEPSGPHLQPFPILRDPDGVRISLPGARP